MEIDNIEYYASFGEDGFPVIVTHEIPEFQTGEEVVEFTKVDKSLSRDLMDRKVIRDQSGIIRLATDEEISERAERIQFNFRSRVVRQIRNQKLEESDRLMLVDRWNSYTEAKRESITEYRQLLRDITLQPSFPNSVTWPELPQ
jgi:hypothetical protein